MKVKLQPQRIRILSVNGQKVVESHELYKATGLKPCNYTRWMMVTVFPLGDNGIDYYPAPENIERKSISKFIKFKLRYYFNIEFAIILCAVVRRREAMQLKEFLKKNQ